MARPFDSAWLKWGWGVVHVQALERDLSAYSKNAAVNLPYTTRTEYDPRGHCVKLLVETIEPLPSRLGLRVGDVASNFLGALDYLAWALAQRGRLGGKLKPAQEARVYFPIATSPLRFKSELKKVPGIRLADRVIIPVTNRSCTARETSGSTASHRSLA